MANELRERKDALPAMAMDERELLNVLQSSLYPGAQEASVKLVISYCKASGLDVMQKPVHIVPMWDGKSRSMRDVIMPGVGLYRTQAARTGEYAGVSAQDLGPDVTETIDGLTVTYPEWCTVTVKRLLSNGTIAEFPATERWKENYAVKGGQQKSIAPNAMWAKRPYGQLAKCAEAQALRKAFPECGSQPTADEMEGKTIDITGQATSTTRDLPKEPEYYPDEDFKKNFPKWEAAIQSGKKSAEDLINMINTKAKLNLDQITKIKQAEMDSAPMDAEVINENT